MGSNRVIKRKQKELAQIADDLENFVNEHKGKVGAIYLHLLTADKLIIRSFLSNLNHRYLRNENGNGT